MKELWFLYNYKQADFFIRNGVPPIGCGKGGKGDIYMQFERNEQSEEIQNLWLKQKYGNAPRPPKE